MDPCLRRGDGTDEIFGLAPDPDNPGWQVRREPHTGRFADIFGAIRVRIEAEGVVRCRIEPQARHLNVNGTIHGGFALALIDHVLFMGPVALGITGSAGGSTLDVTTQFFGPLVAGPPLDAVVEVLRETGKFVFVRGLIEQEGVAAVAFTGKFQKARPGG